MENAGNASGRKPPVSLALAHLLALSVRLGKQSLVKPVRFSYQKSQQVIM
jgi:hypothetical protein